MKGMKQTSAALRRMGYEKTADTCLRLPQVLKIIPVSRSTWWAGVKNGIYPRPIKLGRRITVWKASDIQKLIDDATR
jgi:predicted DNA-binding transcriptional regulator AlpA